MGARSTTPARTKVGHPRRGEVYRVTFDPTIGSEIRKTRPAVVILSLDISPSCVEGSPLHYAAAPKSTSIRANRAIGINLLRLPSSFSSINPRSARNMTSA